MFSGSKRTDTLEGAGGDGVDMDPADLIPTLLLHEEEVLIADRGAVWTELTRIRP